jgi:hypothetical protein
MGQLRLKSVWLHEANHKSAHHVGERRNDEIGLTPLGALFQVWHQIAVLLAMVVVLYNAFLYIY